MEGIVSTVPEDFNVAEALIGDNLAAGRGSKVAIYYQEEEVTYDALAKMVNRTGNALLELEVELENRVALILLDSPAFVASFLGAIKIGAVPVPLSTMLKSQDYEYLLNDSRSKVLVVDEPLLPLVEAVKDNLKFLREVIVVGKAKPGQLAYYQLIEKASEVLEAVPTKRDDQAFWLYSSGSTGFPKGAVHLHHDIIFSADLYARQVLGITENDIMFSAAKLFFAYGLGNNLYFPFRVGAAAVLYPGRPLPEAMFEVIQRFRPTIFYGVPPLYGG